MKNKNEPRREDTQYVSAKRDTVTRKILFPIFILLLTLSIIVGLSFAINFIADKSGKNAPLKQKKSGTTYIAEARAKNLNEIY